MHGLARAFLALRDLASARLWTDKFYDATQSPRTELAYYLCKALREEGQTTLAYYYLLLATRTPGPPPREAMNPYLPVESAIHDYLLDYEKSLLWPHMDGLDDRFTRLHGLALAMRLLEKDTLPANLRESVSNNLEFCVLPLAGQVLTLRPEKSVHDP